MDNLKSKIGLVIPCYNEQDRLPVSAILDYLAGNAHVTILLVNDGSNDKTGEIIDEAGRKCPGQAHTLHLPRNVGKAEAVRQGIMSASEENDTEWVGFWDADLSTPLTEIQTMLDYAAHETDLLMCSRVKRLGASVKRHLWRHVAGRVMATLISNVLKLPVYDTQCGAKLVHRRIVQEVFSSPFLTKWLFDVEILARLIQQRGRDAVLRGVTEVPIAKWRDIGGSKLGFRGMLRALIEIVRIKISYRL
ncbi:glycosyltransferase [Planctomycetota bacterium]